ncbi:NB-ARC and TPR repeat-containig protein [Ectocarpus siliculosus]|uniref:NB-ARC and TPR repeat-containig protein n=1 Tax=Ectocarpus siliculosus TaxID=2880 RepID=D7G7W8_ECTSI|nr:NB-ARC and TPR repeat-containig protein [Ectocarpus siliculosus]|eukprot:CBJ27849.1 NB-ARC and TPR repeat-containig protein [Ectocarpus siliculosus]
MMGRVSILATLIDPLRRAREALQGAGDVKAAMRERLDDYERVVNQFESKLGSISDRRIEPEVTKLLVHFDEITALIRKYTASPGDSLLVRLRKKTDRARLHKELAEELERIDKDMQRQLATIQVLGMMELSNPLPTFSLDVGNAAGHDGGFTWHNLNWWMLLLLVVLVPIALSVCWKHGGGGSSTRPPVPDMAAAPAADTAAAPTVSLALPASYVERNSLISEVVGNLTAANAPRSPYVLQGSGGAGKTVLATAVVRNEEVRKRFGRGIFWLDVGRHGNLKLPALVQRLAREMDVVSENMDGLDDCVRDIAFAVARDNSVPRLLVLDDVWHEEVMDALRPTGLQILVTTRLASVGRGMLVGDMEEGEARELLSKKSGAVALPVPEANQVARDCGCHPLTLVIAGSLRCVREAPDSALAWRELHSEIERIKRSSRGLEMATDSDEEPSQSSLFPVLSLSFERLKVQEQDSFLSLAVLARGVPAPVAMLANLWDKDEKGAKKEASAFVGRSLLIEEQEAFIVHDMLLDFIDVMCQHESSVVQLAVMRQTHYLSRLPVVWRYCRKGESLEGMYSLISLWRPVMKLSGNEKLDVETYEASLRELGEEHEPIDVANACMIIGDVFLLQDQYSEAEPLYQRAEEIYENLQGHDYPPVVTSLSNRASLRHRQGEYAEAERLHEQPQTVREEVPDMGGPDVDVSLSNVATLLHQQGWEEDGLQREAATSDQVVSGPEHPGVALDLNNRAETLITQGKYAAAEPLLERSQALQEKVLGPDHPEVAVSLNRLAELLSAQGNYEEAEPLYKRSMAVDEKVYGPYHPKVAADFQSWAVLLHRQGKYAEAGPYYLRAIDIVEKTLGVDHPNLAQMLNSRAALLDRQGMYDEAGPLYERSQAIREKALGPEHPDVARSLNKRAWLLCRQGKHEQAEPLNERAISIWEGALESEQPRVAPGLEMRAWVLRAQGKHAEAETLSELSQAMHQKALGPEHSDVALSLSNRADELYRQGKDTEAQPLFERAIKIWEKAHRHDHPLVANVLHNRAGLLSAQGKYAKAHALLERALAIREGALGVDHPDTITSLGALADLYAKQGLLEKATPVLEEVVSARERAQGRDHPDVASALSMWAVVLSDQGKNAEALALFEKALAIREGALGVDHPDTITSLGALADLYTKQGLLDKASRLLEEVVNARERIQGSDHPDVASALNERAVLMYQQGEFTEVILLLERALPIRMETLGENHPETLDTQKWLELLRNQV